MQRTALRILITGANGFVGTHLKRILAERFRHATLAALGGTSERSDAVDVRDRDALCRQVAAFRPTHAVHLAAVSSVPEAQANPCLAFAVNQGGVLNLGLALLAHAPDCRVLVISSSEVYGRSFEGRRPLSESAPLLPINVYAASKAAGEMAALALASKGLRVLIVRPFSHTGPGQSTRFALPAFAAQIVAAERKQTEPVLRTGRLDAVRDFCDVRDIAVAYALLLQEFDQFPNATAINVASGRSRSMNELLSILMRLARVPVRQEIDPAKVRPYDLPWTVGDASRLAQATGWRPTIPLEQTLADLLDYHRQAP